jgi:glutamate/aspartate transport system substrate-binding protein
MKTTKKLLGTLVIASLSAGLGTSALAQGTLEKVKAAGAITVGHRDASIPFAYLDDNQKPIGYSMDLCAKIVDAVKAELKMPDLKVNYQPVTSSTRIPLLANGTVDMECGSTTNNADRQKQVAYAPTTFVTATRFVSKKADNLKTLADLKGKTVVSTSGTTNLKLLTEVNASEKLDMNILTAKDHAESFLMVDTGRAAAFVMDDILLAGLAANSPTPEKYAISNAALSVEPYGIMVRKDDPAYKKVVDGAIAGLMKSGEINKIYAKWFTSPIPPRNINLNIPMSDQLKKVVANPTDSPDPAMYK